MTTMQRLITGGGVALAAGAALSAIAAVAQDFVDETTVNTPLTTVGAISVVGGLLMLLGLPAWYAVQAGRMARFGAVAFVTMFLGWAALQVASQPLYSWLAPALYARPGDGGLARPGALEEVSTPFLAYVVAGLIALNLGMLLFGIAMVRARVFPRVLSWLVALGPLAVFFGGAAEQEAVGALLAVVAVCGVLIAVGRVRAVVVPEAPVPVEAG